MTEAQSLRIAQLESEVQELKDKIENLEALRNKLLGVGVATQWAIKIVITLIGVGGLAALARVVQWLSQPMKHP